MTARIVNWQADTEPLGSAVVAIGVFDGVHVGHQALLQDTVADAVARGAHSVAVTFDRDPDQVVAPATAAPQLLTLADKIAAISRCGVDAILVVPFTSQLAEMPPESFLDSVLLAALTPASVHVGHDFRFGRMATGDVSTLQRVGMMRGFAVEPHELVTIDGETVTSTRIRALVAAGDVAAASALLGEHPRVSGVVHRGRGEGAGLGFPTANVVPMDFAALPGDGVYAGRAVLADGSSWAAAISVGTPPMFPDAKDYLEAHLIDFEGDLYDQPITLEFWERTRDQQGYPSLDALKAAIAQDVTESLEIAGFTDDDADLTQPAARTDSPVDAWFAEVTPTRMVDRLTALFEREPQTDDGDDCGDDYISDPAALEAAERAAMCAPGRCGCGSATEWVPLTSSQFNPATATLDAFALTSPLEASNIPFCWEPLPPEDAYSGPQNVPAFRAFTVLVPVEMLDLAQAALAEAATEHPTTELSENDLSYVDDPSALEAAEQAVQNYRKPAQDSSRANEDWILVLDGMRFDSRRFLEIDGALESAGIEHVWEPYRPQDAPLVRISFFDTERFSVSVRESQCDAATDLLGSLPGEDSAE